MFHIKFDNKGQTIIEATIALASIMLTLAAISIAITTSVSNSQFIKNQTLASKYAQSAMEYMSYLRNTDPTTFEARTGIYCMNGDNSLDTGSCPTVNLANTFKREVDFSQDATSDCGGGTEVTVSVYWSSGKCGSVNTFCHKSQLISCFSNESGSGTTL
ncbi:MAG TPA: hypothetical protein VG917_01385 [Patescibacteria group bacterium]|nr:hypothetical protein [Patescibacteria group bacterium]